MFQVITGKLLKLNKFFLFDNFDNQNRIMRFSKLRLTFPSSTIPNLTTSQTFNIRIKSNPLNNSQLLKLLMIV